MRPDEPRRFPDGRIAKYEMPGKERVCLDVPPTVREHIGNPKIPLFITEGIKKGDALASRGACVVSLLGVTCWRGTNEHGGKTTLEDWPDVALNEREVFIVFDSDVMRKLAVYKALVNVRGWLQGRGAKVFLIYLPSEEGGAKVGVDDYFVSGHTLDDLFALATEELRQPPHEEGQEEETGRQVGAYQETKTGLFLLKETRDGMTRTQLTNFTAQIVAEVIEDDGAETRHEYSILATRGERQAPCSIPLSSFASLSWAAEHLGAATIVFPGMTIKDHAQAAIRLMSGEPEQRRVFTHTGWRRFEDGAWGYLHAGGVIGVPEGVAASVRLSGVLERYRLPEPLQGKELQEAVRASLRLLNLGPDRIMVPLLAATYRAALDTADFSLSLAGASGAFKSELAGLAQRHFGAEMDANHLPGSWSSTENALEDLAFRCKDALLTIDDFAPTPGDAQRLHTKADRVLRAQGNNSGRQRMDRTANLRPPRPPRGLILSTGEDVPQGKSLKARQLIIEVEPGDIDAAKLTVCQKQAEAGQYAAVMAGFLSWVAPDYETLRQGMRTDVTTLRGQVHTSGLHRRTPDTIAELFVGFQLFLCFAMERGAISAAERETIEKRAWAALTETARQQMLHQQASDPARRFIELLRSALSSGRAHIADEEGRSPDSPEAWGWRKEPSGLDAVWKPQGERIGWVCEESVYLEKDAAYNVAKRVGADGGEGIALTPTTLVKRVKEAGLLLTVEPTRGTNTIRRVLEGKTQIVLHIARETLVSEKPDKSDISDSQAQEEAGMR